MPLVTRSVEATSQPACLWGIGDFESYVPKWRPQSPVSLGKLPRAVLGGGLRRGGRVGIPH